MNVLAYTLSTNGDEVTITESTGRSVTSTNLDELLDFLLVDWEQGIRTDRFYIVWDLGAFMQPLLDKLPEEFREQLEGADHKTKFWNHNLFYRYRAWSGGLFTIGKYSRIKVATYYSLNQFYPKDMEPPATAPALKILADSLLNDLSKVGITPTKLTSPIAAFLSCNTINLPKIGSESPQELHAGDYAFECTMREWRDCFMVGHWYEDEVWDYDIVNAYASIAARLPDTRNAEYIFSTEYVDDAYFGFLKGRVTIKDDTKVSFIMRQFPDGTLGTPTGSWETYLTLHEVRCIEKAGIGSFDLTDGWFVRFEKAALPLKPIMTQLYSDRTRAESKALSHFLKTVANGLIGKFLEKHDDGTLGDYYNPIWHSMITSTCRLNVARFIYGNDAVDNVIAINTDGCVLDKPVIVKQNPQLGDWRLSGKGPLLALSPTLIFTADKKPQGINYQTLTDLIKESPNTFEYGSINLMALAQSQTRKYESYPQSGAELMANKYESKPLKISE